MYATTVGDDFSLNNNNNFQNINNVYLKTDTS